ncbi:MAG: NUDIX hydrolase [Proteobacteria bacterium]|nr:NUDIX hydrolase [Pseudomonadota bacterium]
MSIKGVVFVGDRVVLLKNERDEWELPGGKLEPGEDPIPCLAREIAEELSITVEVGAILDCWRYDIRNKVEVVVVSYGCHAGSAESLKPSNEHKALGLFTLQELGDLKMPDGYRRAIRRWQELRTAH